MPKDLSDQLCVVEVLTKLELGGAQKVCLELLSRLSKKEMSCHLISGKTGPLVETAQKFENTLLLDEFIRECSPKILIQDFKLLFRLVREFRRLKKHHARVVVHTHSTKAGIVGRIAAFLARIKYRVHTVHGHQIQRHQNKFTAAGAYLLEFVCSFLTSHYIFVSSKDQDFFHKWIPRSRKSSIIRAGVDFGRFYIPARKIDRWPSTDNNFIFGSVASFKPCKNILDTLMAFRIVANSHPKARLEIVGDGILRTEIEKEISALGLTAKVKLWGWQDNIAGIMCNWKALVITSLWEGLPCAAVEARIMHIPVVSYDVGGISDLISNTINGIITKKKDWQGIAEGMLLLIENPDIHRSLAHHPDDLSDFNSANMARKHLLLYRRLTGSEEETISH